ncbi:Potassium channel domain containing protein [Parasponia andersonii]|uniref:Potassium channel domain containing protein n=1 Tax=Parasponia andersonii TaxID=3476 RepID=A0A2P5A3Y9_PARAD|nr:Potassium channel domain containing protein [Parasponia andersonii]
MNPEMTEHEEDVKAVIERLFKPEFQQRLTRCLSAPSTFIPVEKEKYRKETFKPKIWTIEAILMALALVAVIVFYMIAISINASSFKGEKRSKIVDSFYFTMVTVSTVGYGDLFPYAPLAKLVICCFMLLSSLYLNHALNVSKGYISHFLIFKKLQWFRRWLRKRWRRASVARLFFAIFTAISSLCLGTIGIHFIEKLSWRESLCLSIVTSTTVGYGDQNFKSTEGRVFAGVWMIYNLFTFADSMLYIAHFRLNWSLLGLLKRNIAVVDVAEGALRNSGAISKEEFVLLMLKKMKLIHQVDVEIISRKFEAMAGVNPRLTTGHIIDDYKRRGVALA